ncbi:hypothetical protein L0N33_20370, partial [Roseburia faecis]|nr:hypothetical protein [Roseburia faecis]
MEQSRLNVLSNKIFLYYMIFLSFDKSVSFEKTPLSVIRPGRQIELATTPKIRQTSLGLTDFI